MACLAPSSRERIFEVCWGAATRTIARMDFSQPFCHDGRRAGLNVSDMSCHLFEQLRPTNESATDGREK